MSPTEEANLATMKRFYDDVVNKGNLDLIDELMTDDFIEHEEFPGLESSKEGVKKFFQIMRGAFPDLRFEADFMIAQGDKVAVYMTMTGTQQGEFMGMPASGNKVNVKAVDIVRFQDGKAAEHWGVTDSLTMMQQLGVAPQ